MSGLVGVVGGSVGCGRLDGGLGDGQVLWLDVGCWCEMDVAVEWAGHEVMGFVGGWCASGECVGEVDGAWSGGVGSLAVDVRRQDGGRVGGDGDEMVDARVGGREGNGGCGEMELVATRWRKKQNQRGKGMGWGR
ncbi:eggshell protein-like [Eucalyptus grandis]|uniref:eggshell protein-like n=1 Tax=Eucalyptus grandis TaxID=71139 RepID=UPI00192EFBC2|nr:eggshell protein-like [Eucalyptus grandis]